MCTTVKELHLKRKKMWDGGIANHQKYLDASTKLFSEKYVEYRNCPVCNVSSNLFLFAKEGGRYWKCSHCEMVYLNPVFKDKYLDEYYSNNHTFQSEVVEEDLSFYSSLYEKGLRAIGKVIGPGSLLDMGCSSGVFLDTASRFSWETYGVELNKLECDKAKSKGHIVYNELVESIQFNVLFDAITLWDVFEHLKDGALYLKLLTSLLSEKGVVFLQIPSADSLAARVMKEECNMFDGLEHVNLYSYKAIEKLANQCGLEVVSMETVISEIGVMNNYLNYESPYFGTANNTTKLLSFLDEKMIHDQKLGYKMQIILSRA